jgi:tRNA-dihydrouridine synthase
MNIWQELPQHFTVLAPMEGVTDVVFRRVIAKAGRPDLFFTEFTNVSSYASEKGRHDALERLEVVESDKPIVAQIWGKNPEHFGMLAGELSRLGFAGLDINMGCPDRHVNKAGGGAAMIRTPELAVECIAQAKQNTVLPVSVKTRLGFTFVEEYKDWLSLLLSQDLAALTVHL